MLLSAIFALQAGQVFDAAKDLRHQIGRPEADGWSARIGEKPNQYMCFGPYVTGIDGSGTATFEVMIDNITLDKAAVITLDVRDYTSGKVLAIRKITRPAFEAPMEYQKFSLPYRAGADSKLEFRTLWHGNAYIRERSVVVTRGGS